MEPEEDKRHIKPDNFDISELITSLQGTCNTLDQTLESLYEVDVDILTEEDHAQIDNEVFRCDTCGWWYEISEQEDDNTCSDCYEDEVEKLDDDEDYGDEDKEED